MKVKEMAVYLCGTLTVAKMKPGRSWPPIPAPHGLKKSSYSMQLDPVVLEIPEPDPTPFMTLADPAGCGTA